MRESFDGNALTMTLSQATDPTPGQPVKQPLALPISLKLLGGGDQAQLSGLPETAPGVFVLDQATGQLTVTGLSERPVVSLLRGFSAPVRLDHRLAADELATIMRDDTDAFARWNAGQRLIEDAVSAMLADGDPAPALDAFATAIGETDSHDPVVPEWLSLPSTQSLADVQARVDVEALAAASATLQRGVAQRLADRLPAMLEGSAPDGPWTFSKSQVARRRLHGACLSLLAKIDAPACESAATRLFEQADNLSDRLAAMAAVNDLALDTRERLLAAFKDAWAEEALVMDHWFRLQACSQVGGTPDRITTLLGNSGYARTRPNRVRALMGTFARANFEQFNTQAGYRVVADEVSQIDPLNAQLAARLVKPLTAFGRLTGPHSGWMRAALASTVARDKASANLVEIVSAALD